MLLKSFLFLLAMQLVVVIVVFKKLTHSLEPVYKIEYGKDISKSESCDFSYYYVIKNAGCQENKYKIIPTKKCHGSICQFTIFHTVSILQVILFVKKYFSRI
jgi:hypothetical protein